ncbi:hypothetical protein CHARACLAT_015109 [Characodon lateralis]|uniref:Uncharacterized protein n=1 Tax=Characodon lateralis TaxID=208331 RepID=A0ABU7DUF4_9TELE|nr:hypothetical protein [Characodon lateralis]
MRLVLLSISQFPLYPLVKPHHHFRMDRGEQELKGELLILLLFPPVNTVVPAATSILSLPSSQSTAGTARSCSEISLYILDHRSDMTFSIFGLISFCSCPKLRPRKKR